MGSWTLERACNFSCQENKHYWCFVWWSFMCLHKSSKYTEIFALELQHSESFNCRWILQRKKQDNLCLWHVSVRLAFPQSLLKVSEKSCPSCACGYKYKGYTRNVPWQASHLYLSYNVFFFFWTLKQGKWQKRKYQGRHVHIGKFYGSKDCVLGSKLKKMFVFRYFFQHKKIEAGSQIHQVDISVSAKLKQAESKGLTMEKLPICST